MGFGFGLGYQLDISGYLLELSQLKSFGVIS